MIVNETNYEDCTRPLTGMPLISGKDEVKLSTPGKKWYICGAPGHCAAGQKLAITVSDGAASASPTVEPSSPKSSASAAAGGNIVRGGFVVVGIIRRGLII
ncbi:Blue copper protein [Linum grandiflorum]